MKLHGLFFQPPIEDNYVGHITSEVYRDKIFEPFIPKNKEDSVCVEIGANVGIVSYYFAQYFGKVYAIEPSEQHFNTLKHMVEYNELKNVEPHKLAIYLKEGKYPFFHNKNKTMFSLHTAVDDKTTEAETVDTMPLDKFFKENNIDHCNLLKVDCEGSEHEIIGSAGFKEVAPIIDNVVLEWHEWSGRPMSQLKDTLEMRGFKVEQVPSSASILVGRK